MTAGATAAGRGTPAPALGTAALAARAAYVLRGNDLGTMTTAAPQLYPHMWSWDAAFVSIGLATLSVPRAVLELDTLLAARWRTGMIPHIVFAPGVTDYFPGPDRWGCAESGAPVPAAPRTSGICQPPVHAIAVQRVVEAGRRGSSADREAAEAFLARAWAPLVAWHRFLATARDPGATGLVTLFHGWESGMDNSPRWDGPYSRVRVGPDLPPYSRRDTVVVDDVTQRPTDVEYDRYLWLVEQLRRVGYDAAAARVSCDFAVGDVFVSAIMALACDVLADLGSALPPGAVAAAGGPAGAGRDGGVAADVADLRSWAERFRRGVAAAVDPATGVARDLDVRTGGWIPAPTVAGFAPLLCGGLDAAAEARMLALLDGPEWCGHPGLRTRVPPSTSPTSPAFRPREYWRGPQWPFLAWLLAWAFDRRGWTDRAAALREEGMRLVGDGQFAEYYEPFTGEPLGSMRQSWTAAAVLDWLCTEI